MSVNRVGTLGLLLPGGVVIGAAPGDPNGVSSGPLVERDESTQRDMIALGSVVIDPGTGTWYIKTGRILRSGAIRDVEHGQRNLKPLLQRQQFLGGPNHARQ